MLEGEFAGSRIDRLAYQPKRARLVGRLLAALLAVSLATLAVGLANARGEAWAPLGPFPAQSITTDQPIDVYSGAVGVDGTKCYNESVQVTGSLAWRSVDEPGQLLGHVEFPSAEKLAGCVGLSFANPIPDDVAEVVCSNGPTRWAIVGNEKPIGQIRDDGTIIPRSGLALGWQTETFELSCGAPQ